MPKKVYIRTYGCQMNVRDTDALTGLLLEGGYSVVENEKEADVILFNTCSVRKHAEDRVWGKVSMLRRDIDNGKIIGIIGCMAQNYKEKIFSKLPNVNFIAGPGEIYKVPNMIEESLKSKDKKSKALTLKKRPEFIYKNTFRKDASKVYVSISEGCNNHCSYCIVPYVRGAQQDRPWQVILEEVKDLLEQGFIDITLIGQNVNSYAGGISFPELLEKVSKLKGLRRLSFVTSHPKDAGEELFKTMAGLDNVVKFLHLPVQSGSDRILNMMNRKYTVSHYVKLVTLYRRLVKDGKISTDIIVGFPTETDTDFNKTFQLMKEVRFDSAYIFKYSPRPNTEASKIKDDVPKDIKEKRHKILLDFQKKLWSERKRD